MARGPTVGRKPDQQNKVRDAGQAETGRSGRRQHQEARLEVLPAKDRSLPHRATPAPNKKPPLPPVLVVRVRNTDARPPLRGVRRVEGAAEDPVGGGQEGDRKMEEPLEGQGPTGG